ncbi:hypothetical protein Smp_146880 [Schistosoma mansoni]|uniref:hypothetical protein n=1 Tax=Schistosoma mansoni TaxID=6183 RepID=UPI0001A6379A|nr:hypothetical protein Smp_146880 [Schistosoma mansoni]|eukprot:XP_018655012.1 hypothetical protein Smp_146880 [Schistosoma mansoni]
MTGVTTRAIWYQIRESTTFVEGKLLKVEWKFRKLLQNGRIGKETEGTRETCLIGQID